MALGRSRAALASAGLLAALGTPALPAAASTGTAAGGNTVAVTSVDDAAISGTVGRFSYAGTWSTSTAAADYQGSDHYTSTAGASVTLTFTGTQVQLYAATASWHGRALASIDGGPGQQVDFYAASRQEQTLVYRSQLLGAGVHTLVLTAAGARRRQQRQCHCRRPR